LRWAHKMRNRLLIIILIGFYVIISLNPALSQEKVYFDIKTRFLEKADLMPAKAGATIVLMQSEWAGVREFGEDYSVWLTNYQSEKKKDILVISLDVELRAPSAVRTGSLIKQKRITVRMQEENDWENVDSITDAIERELKNNSANLKTEAMIIGQEVEQSLRNFLKMD